MRRPGDKKPLKFRTTVKENKIRHRKVALIFTAIVLLVALLSGIVLFRETGFGHRKETGFDSSTMHHTVNILFGGTDTDGELVFLSRLSINTRNGTGKITGISPLSRYERQTFNEILGRKEADAISRDKLVKAVGERYDEKFDRYLIVNEENIGRVLLKLGYYDIELKEEFKYEGSRQTLHLLKGQHSLNGNEFYTYLKYMGGGHSVEETDAQTEVIADWLNQELTPGNFEKSQALYESLVNAVSTNITINDFARYTSFLEKASDREKPIKAQKTVF
ncbi:MAG: LCP family protein, partial [Acutalibacteraceae bacterium]|nr:LCP family protein [Acutalibacteraceae bacterium]